MTDATTLQAAIRNAEVARVDYDLTTGEENMILQAMGLLAAVDRAVSRQEGSHD